MERNIIGVVTSKGLCSCPKVPGCSKRRCWRIWGWKRNPAPQCVAWLQSACRPRYRLYLVAWDTSCLTREAHPAAEKLRKLRLCGLAQTDRAIATRRNALGHSHERPASGILPSPQECLSCWGDSADRLPQRCCCGALRFSIEGVSEGGLPNGSAEPASTVHGCPWRIARIGPQRKEVKS